MVLNIKYKKFILSVASPTTNLLQVLLRLLTNIVLGICYCVHLFQHAPESSSSQSPLSLHQTTNEEEAEQALRASHKKPAAGLSRSTNLHRAGSVKDLITKFSGSDHVSSSSSPQSPSSGTGKVSKSASAEALYSPKSTSSLSTPSSVGQAEGPVPSITLTPPCRATIQDVAQSAQRSTKSSQIAVRIDCPVEGSAEKKKSGRDSVADSGMGSVSKKTKTPGRQF